MQRKTSNSVKSSSSNVPSEHENTRNVLVILLGWNGAYPRHLSKYNNIYDNYEDYIINLNKASNNEENGAKVHIIIKQFIAPVCMVMFNICMLPTVSDEILDAIQSHRESFGSSSYIIIHSFSSAGSLILCSMNDTIIKQNRSIYYDGIIYDSPHLGPLSMAAGIKVIWELVTIKLLPNCICYDTSSANENQLCGCLFVWCKIWYFIVYLLFFLLALILIPLTFLIGTIYILLTCTCGYIWCHHKKLLSEDNHRILCVPMLLLGSDTDHINPIKKSIQFVQDKINKIEKYKDLRPSKKGDHKIYDASMEANEDTILLPVNVNNGGGIDFDINELDGEYIKDSNKYFVFEKSKHVRHYQMYPKIYQREVNEFLDLCLNIQKDDYAQSQELN